MTEDKVKKDEVKIFAEYNGHYVHVDNKKVTHIYFPSSASKQDVHNALIYISNEINKSIQEDQKIEEEKSKAALHDKEKAIDSVDSPKVEEVK